MLLALSVSAVLHAAAPCAASAASDLSSPPFAPACVDFAAAIGMPLAAGNAALVPPIGGLDPATRTRLLRLLADYPGAEHPEACTPLHYLRLAELLLGDAAQRDDRAAQADLVAAAWGRALRASGAPVCPPVVLAVHARVVQQLAARGWLGLSPPRRAALDALVGEGLPALQERIRAGRSAGGFGLDEEREMVDPLRAYFVAEVMADR